MLRTVGPWMGRSQVPETWWLSCQSCQDWLFCKYITLLAHNVLFLKSCVAITVTLNCLIHEDLTKSFFQKCVCRRSWLNGWTGCFKKTFSCKSSVLERYFLQKLVEWLNWPTSLIFENMSVAKSGRNGWIGILWWSNLQVSSFFSYASQLLVELVDSQSFAKILFHSLLFKNSS